MKTYSSAARFPLTRDIAHAHATDLANRQMRRENRTSWNEGDYNLSVSEFARLWPLECEYPWASPAQIATMKQQLGY